MFYEIDARDGFLQFC